MLYFSPWKIFLILAVVLLGVLFSVPNLVPANERFVVRNGAVTSEPAGIWAFPLVPHNSVNLGLDLRGGAHLVFEVNLEEVKEDRLVNLAEEASVALRQAPVINVRRPSVVGDEVVVRVARAEDMDAAWDRLQDLSQPVGNNALAQQGGFGAQTVAFTRDDAERIIRLTITPEALEEIQTRTVTQSIEVIRRRIDETGLTEPTIARQGDNRVLVQVPGEANPQRIIDLVNTTARMTFHLVDSTVTIDASGNGRTPPGVEIMPTERPGEPWLAVQRRAMVDGENLTNASAAAQNGQPVVQFQFDTAGATAFGRATSQNVGRRFAIVLDGVIISAPSIRSPILGGSGIIEGGFTYESANDLAILLNAGALPASLTPVEQRTVTAGLGQDQIRAGTLAVIVGFAAVIIFMLAAYGVFGVFSNIALLANVTLILGALSGLQASLTLPGIAGIILTIGMAVDANVLIFERIREEVRAGRSPANAIETGYARALSAILDANITTFIAAAVLFMLGAGPVRGFAVTLGIGIITSVFTAYLLSRLLVAMWFKAFKPQKLGF